MDLLLKRVALRQSYTVGKLYVDGKYFCDTIEDADRGLDDCMSLEEIKRIKQPGITAIPTGTYDILMDIVSPRFSVKKQYQFCGGKLPRLNNVKGFDGVLIHIGNTDNDSAGCILVGKNNAVGKVLNSTQTFVALYEVLESAHRKGEKIQITIKK